MSTAPGEWLELLLVQLRERIPAPDGRTWSLRPSNRIAGVFRDLHYQVLAQDGRWSVQPTGLQCGPPVPCEVTVPVPFEAQHITGLATAVLDVLGAQSTHFHRKWPALHTRPLRIAQSCWKQLEQWRAAEQERKRSNGTSRTYMLWGAAYTSGTRVYQHIHYAVPTDAHMDLCMDAKTCAFADPRWVWELSHRLRHESEATRFIGMCRFPAQRSDLLSAADARTLRELGDKLTPPAGSANLPPYLNETMVLLQPFASTQGIWPFQRSLLELDVGWVHSRQPDAMAHFNRAAPWLEIDDADVDAHEAHLFQTLANQEREQLTVAWPFLHTVSVPEVCAALAHLWHVSLADIRPVNQESLEK